MAYKEFFRRFGTVLIVAGVVFGLNACTGSETRATAPDGDCQGDCENADSDGAFPESEDVAEEQGEGQGEKEGVEGSESDSPATDGEETELLPEGTLILNEVNCHQDDWIEIANPTVNPIDLGGYVVSDDPVKAGHQYLIPKGTVVAPGGQAAVHAQTGTAAGFTFGIACAKDTIYLAAPGGKVIDQTSPAGVPIGSTWCRLPDRSPFWQECYPTPGAPNRSAQGELPEVFDPLQVNTIDLTLTEDAISALNLAPDTYVAGQFKFVSAQTTTEVLPVGIKLKGGHSFEPLTGKAALKVKFDFSPDNPFATFHGLKHLTLNNMVQDPTMMHETLAYKIFAAFKVPGPRTGYAWVRVNGEDYGLYLALEDLDDVFLARQFANVGHLYNASADLLVAMQDRFQVEQGSATDKTDLQTLITVVNNTPDATWLGEVSLVADLTEMLKEWSVENYTAHWDGYIQTAKNYYLESNPKGFFTMIPYGADQTFTQDMAIPYGTSLMTSRCLAIPACKQQFVQHLLDLAPVVEGLALPDFISKLRAVIGPKAAADPRKPALTAEQWNAAVNALTPYLNQRIAQLKALPH